MPIATVTDLVEDLRRLRLLEPTQLEELDRSLRLFFPEPRALARDLVHRGWLTPYQVNELFLGRGNALLLGSYVLLERLGEGGMGAVFKAKNWKIGRVVALKIIRKERLARPQAVLRFKREMMAAAQLSHPNVILTHDADEVADVHFYAMEYVEGTDLSRLVKQHGPLAVSDACHYIRQAALGLQHVHERGMIHRDIKPSNLLVTRHNVVKILDLGLVRIDEGSDSGLSFSTLTVEGAVMGTVDYMAPEQAEDLHAADIRADLYALGCTFHFLLTGRVPFPGGSFAQKVRKHLTSEPPSIAEVRPDVPDVVCDVVRKLMAKRPADRYQTPAELAAALEQITSATQGTPSEAPPVPLGDPLIDTDSRFSGPGASDTAASTPPTPVRKRRGLYVGIAVAVLVLLGVVGAFVAWRLGLFTSPLNLAGQADLSLESDVPNAVVHVRREGREVATLGGASGQRITLDAGSYTLQLDDPQGLTLSAKEVKLAAGTPQTVRVQGEPASPLGLMSLVGRPARLQGVRSWTIALHTGSGPVQAIAWNPKGTWLAVANRDGAIRLFPAEGDKPPRILIGHSGAVRSLAVSGDGSRLASVGEDRMVRIWDTQTGKSLLTPLAVDAQCAAWSPDGKLLALAIQKDVELRDPETGRMTRIVSLRENQAERMAWSPDGGYLAFVGGDSTVRVWQMKKESLRRFSGHAATVRTLAWSPDSEVLATGDANEEVRFWKVQGTGSVPAPLAVPRNGLKVMAWSVAGTLATAGGAGDGEIRLWDPVAGQVPRVLKGARMGVTCLAWSPDGKVLADGRAERNVRLLDPQTGDVRRTLIGNPEGTTSVTWSPDGKQLATSHGGGLATTWNASTGERGAVIRPGDEDVQCVAWSPGAGEFLALGTATGVHVQELNGSRLLTLGKVDGGVTVLAWSPDGKRIASGGKDRKVRLWRWDQAGEEFVLDRHTAEIRYLVFSPDGKYLASCADDYRVTLWKTEDGKPARDLLGQKGHIRALAWSPDGKQIAGGGVEKQVYVWAADNGKVLQKMPGHQEPITALAWNGDGKLLSLGEDAMLRTWDPMAGKSVGTLHGMMGVGVFSPDQKLIASGGDGFRVRVWDVATGKPQGTLATHHSGGGVVVSPEGHFRATKPEAERDLVYVVETGDGQETLSVEEFGKRFGWKNDPERARLVPASR